MALILRDYQQRVVNSIYKYFSVEKGNPVVEAPTSAGKSLIMAEFVTGIYRQWPGQRVLLLAHVRELIEQNYLELIGHWPNAPAGVNAASLNSRDYSDPIIFAMIQSVHNSALYLGHRDLVIIDECHLVPVKQSDGMYRKLIDELTEINPNLKVIGLSATPYRLDNGMLTDGKNRLFTDIIPAKANGASIDDLLAGEYLSPLVVPTGGIETRLSVEGVKKTAGDYNQKQLAEAVDVDDTTRAAVDEIVHHGANRRSWLIFATSVAHAEHIAAALFDHDIEAEVVTGKTASGARRDITERFKSGALRCLVNVNCLTTGFNARCVDLLAFMRPTHSTNLYIQMAGRGMRLSPETGKTDCLVLDFAGLIDKHGPVNDVTPPARKGEGKGDAPVKECDQCYMLVPAGAAACPYCDFKFPPPDKVKINEFASRSAIIKTPEEIEIERRAENAPTRHEIHEVRYFAHQKPGSTDSLRVEYWAGEGMIKVKVASEWVCLFHSGKAKANAAQWWNEHVGALYQPGDILQAVEFAKKYAVRPDYIFTKPDGKYTRVISRGVNKAEEVI